MAADCSTSMTYSKQAYSFVSTEVEEPPNSCRSTSCTVICSKRSRHWLFKSSRILSTTPEIPEAMRHFMWGAPLRQPVDTKRASNASAICRRLTVSGGRGKK